MSDPNLITNQAGSPDYDALLQKELLGKVAPGGRAFSGIYSATVVTQAPGVDPTIAITVDIDGFNQKGSNATWTARYEKRLGATPPTPPVGTRCLVAFPPNEADGSPWATTFVGWPT
jgi:hypothetical protein